ncbi:MAG: acyltransferase family protein [Candidatus Levybacteria bacterium]|nr:acyltransferase family protein [Candidatus Levybacteria bacterium]
MKKHGRIMWIDLVRIFAIFLVVLLHNSRLPSEITLLTLPSFIVLAVAKTSVPLFVMVSGALLLGKVESYRVFFKKRASRILLPWLLWSCIFFFVEKSSSLFTVVMTRFWFMPLIAGIYFLTPALRLFVARSKIQDIFYVVLLWLGGIILLPYLYPSVTFSVGFSGSVVTQVLQFSGYFLLGLLLIKVKKIEHAQFLSSALILVGIVGAIITTILLKPCPPEQLRFFDYVSPFIVALSAGVFMWFKIRFSGVSSPTVVKIADASFGIIFVHELFNLFFWQNPQNPLNFMANLPYVGYDFIRAVIPFGLAFGVVLLLRKITILKNKLV